MEYYAKDCELVIGLVCPIGVNIELVIQGLESLLKQYNYGVNPVHLSKLAEDRYTNSKIDFKNEFNRTLKETGRSRNVTSWLHWKKNLTLAKYSKPNANRENDQSTVVQATKNKNL